MSNPVIDPAELVRPRYERKYGVHNFEMHDGKTASVISQPSWEHFFFVIRMATPRSLGEIALGPKLITFPEGIRSIPSQRAIVDERVGQVREVSVDHPGTTFIFGTPTFDDSRNGSRGHRPASSALFINRGKITAQVNQRYPSSEAEKDIFTFQQEEGLPRTIDPELAVLVCGDVVGEGGSDDTKEMLLRGTGQSEPLDLVDESTRDVLISSSWAKPMNYGPGADGSAMLDGPFRQSLETRVGRLFQNNPDLANVIVADRVANVEGIEGPYNAQFTRKPA
jgi:hypothetical protein